MQKLKLSELHLYGNEILTKGQMKKVLGGVLSGTCGVINYVSGSAGKCLDQYGTSMATAIDNRDYINANLGNGEINWWSASQATYCCDSCGDYAQCTYSNAF